VSGAYPGLGFDPTPGEPGAVQAALQTFATAGEQIGQILPQLQSAVEVADGWDGDAAEEFSDYGDDIPNGLAEGAESMGQAADALITWFGQLVNNKAQAEALDAMARKLKRQLDAAWEAERDASFALSTAVSPRAQASAREDLDTAVQAIGTLQTELDIVLDEARQLQQTHLDQANAAADAIRGAKGDAFQPVSWFAQATGVAGSALSEISAWTGRAAFVAAMVPVVGDVPAGVLAATSAGTGLTGTGLKLYSKSQGAPGMANASTVGLLLDGLLSVGGPAGKGVGQALKGLKAAREEAAELGVRGLAGKAAKSAFDEGQLGKVITAFRDARGASSVKDALERIGAAQVENTGKLSAVEKALKGTGMGGSSAMDLANYADKASGGDGLTPWQKLPGKAVDAPGLVTDAVNNAVREPFKPRKPEHSGGGGSW
jgi:uncharacterized protein YukE